MDVIDLVEEETLSVPEDRLTRSTAIALYQTYAKRIHLDFPNPVNGFCYLIRSPGYIGFLPVDPACALRISPKVPIANVFRLLEYVYDLKPLRMLDGLHEVGSVESVLESLASILARRVLERSRKGLYFAYVGREEWLASLRGRVQAAPTTMRLLRGGTQASCRFDEHTADVEDNQIVAWTLDRLSAFPIRREDVRSQVNKAYRELAHRVSLRHFDAQACVGRLYHRLNQDYQPLHSLCRFFLEHSGPTVDVGDHTFIPFVLDMPLLFEQFVAEWLKEYLPSQYRIATQKRVDLDKDGTLFWRIDMVLLDAHSGQPLAVLDTKYTRGETPDSDYISQVTAYAYSVGAPTAFLVYPSPIGAGADVMVGKNIRVVSVACDIGQEADAAGQSLLARILNLIDYGTGVANPLV